MHHTAPTPWTHSHNYAFDTSIAERRTRLVIALTATMMIVEIAAGLAYNSMALLADGWHMSTHVTAFLITAIAYYFGRRHSVDVRYSFGTGKMGVLGGFTSAVICSWWHFLWQENPSTGFSRRRRFTSTRPSLSL